jgi:signal transduction histidine kinase
MPLVATGHDPLSRSRVIPVYLQHGIAGVVILALATWFHADETGAILTALGPSAPVLIVLFFLFATSLALMKFPLTEDIFVSLVITADIAMFPLLGTVISAWIAVAAAIGPRLLGMAQIGPSKVDMRDPPLEWARTFAMFATYGVPVMLATLAYQDLGGTLPLLHPSLAAAGRIAAGALVLMVSNELIVSRVEQAYGYSPAMSLKLGVVDSSIYVVTIPYAILTTFAYRTMGVAGVLASAFTGIMGNAVGRKLAVMRNDREQLIQRLASLTNIGKTISLSYSTDELLEAVYRECGNVIDVSIFSIALLDISNNELSFELNVEQGAHLLKTRLPVGDGLNSWVVKNGKPLLLMTGRDEERVGVRSYDDGVPAESWLGVPMITRDHVTGVISVQSLEKNVFSYDDMVLLTAIANQAAVAIENAQLYRDLEGLNLALEQRVLDRTNELREANLRLTAADRSKNQFLASMSHELRTPLNAIIGFSGILAASTQNVLQPRLYRFLENISTAGNHLLGLINDILDLAKIESGKLELQADTFDLRETVNTVERVIKGMAAEHDITVVTTIDSSIDQVFLDEGRVKQILLNLLSNAVKFSHRGGFIHLTVSNIPGHPLAAAGAIRFEVADAGIGIPAEALDHIFDEFYQVQEHGRQGRAGTGLGLSLTRSFVEMHHGTIEVSSRLGEGTKFTVHLPQEYKAAPTPDESPQAVERDAERMK